MTTIKELKQGDWFTLKDIECPKESQVWVRGGYDREEKKYECYKWSDVNSFRYMAGTKEVFTDFIF